MSSSTAFILDQTPGACAIPTVEDDFVVSMNAAQFGSYLDPTKSPACNVCLIIQAKNGVEARARVVDKCAGCKHGEIGLSPAVFQYLSGHNSTDGRLPVNWRYCDVQDIPRNSSSS